MPERRTGRESETGLAPGESPDVPPATSGTSVEAQMTVDTMTAGHFCSLLRMVLDAGAAEAFEDGMDSEFSRALAECVLAGRSGAVEALGKLIEDGRAAPEVGGEALRILGAVSQPETRSARRLLLERHLLSDSPYLRDGAAVGLSELDDPAALPAVDRAIGKTKSALSRMRLSQLRTQLMETRGCLSLPES